MTSFVVPARREDENNREYAFRTLNDNIIKLNLKPNTVINEAEVCKMLNISRTPVREAILQLKEHSLVQVFPQKASIVTRINLGLLREGFFLRSEIEPLVYTGACQMVSREVSTALKENLDAQKTLLEEKNVSYEAFFALDSEFHYITYAATGNTNIWRAIESISGHFLRMRHFDAMYSIESINDFYADHKTIYYGLISGSIKPIRELYPNHLAFYQSRIPKLLEQYPDYFEA